MHHLEGSVSSGAVLVAKFPNVEHDMRDAQMEFYSWPVLLIGGATIIVSSIVLGIVGRVCQKSSDSD